MRLYFICVTKDYVQIIPCGRSLTNDAERDEPVRVFKTTAGFPYRHLDQDIELLWFLQLPANVDPRGQIMVKTPGDTRFKIVKLRDFTGSESRCAE